MNSEYEDRALNSPRVAVAPYLAMNIEGVVKMKTSYIMNLGENMIPTIKGEPEPLR